jgi:hypothetical protein
MLVAASLTKILLQLSGRVSVPSPPDLRRPGSRRRGRSGAFVRGAKRRSDVIRTPYAALAKGKPRKQYLRSKYCRGPSASRRVRVTAEGISLAADETLNLRVYPTRRPVLHFIDTSTRRAWRSSPATLASVCCGFSSSTRSFGTPAASSMSRTAKARRLASSSFTAREPEAE